MNTAATEPIVETNPSPKLSPKGYLEPQYGGWTARVRLSGGSTLYLYHCRYRRGLGPEGQATHAAIGLVLAGRKHHRHVGYYLSDSRAGYGGVDDEYRRAVDLLETVAALLPDPPTQEVAAE